MARNNKSANVDAETSGGTAPAEPAPPVAGLLLRRSNNPEASTGSDQAKAGAALAARVEHEIIEMGWPVGQVLGSETDLLDRYQVSRAVFREAVRLLEHQMVARMRRGPGGGLVITAPDGSSVTNAVALYLEYCQVQPTHLLESRKAIELRCVELAAERIDDVGADKLRALLAKEAASDPTEFAAHSHELHIALAEVTGDPVMGLFLSVLTRLTGEHAHLPAEHPEEGSQQAHAVHSKIVDAVIAGDAALARRRMTRHLDAMAPWLT